MDVNMQYLFHPDELKKKDMLHVPWKSTIELSASQAAVVMRIGALSDRDTAFAHNSLRDVYMYNHDTFDASRLLMGIGRGRLGEWWARLRQSFTELLSYSEGTDLVLLIEPAHEAESTLFLTVADGLRMIDDIGSEREGNIDLKPFVETLQEIDYQGFVSDELGSAASAVLPLLRTTDYTAPH
jgi:hypothetical protein